MSDISNVVGVGFGATAGTMAALALAPAVGVYYGLAKLAVGVMGGVAGAAVAGSLYKSGSGAH